MTKRLVDTDDKLREAARAAVGTPAVEDMVKESLRNTVQREQVTGRILHRARELVADLSDAQNGKDVEVTPARWVTI